MMLDNILQIISSSNIYVESGTLFCNEWRVTNKKIIQCLLDNNCIEQNLYIDDISIGDIISLELSISELYKMGFYDTYENFILKNKYKFSQNAFYILEDKIYSKDKNSKKRTAKIFCLNNKNKPKIAKKTEIVTENLDTLLI